jgi:hypothetical protein
MKVAMGEVDQLAPSTAGVRIPGYFWWQSGHLEMCKSGFYRDTGNLSDPFTLYTYWSYHWMSYVGPGILWDCRIIWNPFFMWMHIAREGEITKEMNRRQILKLLQFLQASYKCGTRYHCLFGIMINAQK